ncbi:MAG: NDP-hexose 2,3-dehydratase family protein, partial [Lachnospiraceae bacterium]|nr:NDP-hexose 2,3-dehydratase family protein [Lachnospiraceae bacterium]
KQDNMVNMDTRTVLSCIPYVLLGNDADVPFKNKSYFYKTAWNLDRKTIVELYHRINDYKMLHRPKTEIVRLDELKSWSMKDNEFACNGDYPFNVIFCEISIEGREVTNWRQPLFASNGIATFGLICCDDEGMIKFLVQIKPEIGCFDLVEIGPTIQREFSMCPRLESDIVERIFTEKLKTGTGIIADCILSEEGGRFYREQNRNVIIKVDKAEIGDLPPNYVWSDYGTLNILTQVNNCLNIQLRNLLSLLEL